MNPGSSLAWLRPCWPHSRLAYCLCSETTCMQQKNMCVIVTEHSGRNRQGTVHVTALINEFVMIEFNMFTDSRVQRQRQPWAAYQIRWRKAQTLPGSGCIQPGRGLGALSFRGYVLTTPTTTTITTCKTPNATESVTLLYMA